MTAVAAAYQPDQRAVPVVQRHRDTIHFGLHPDIRASREPFLERLGICELGQPGLGDRMGYGPFGAVKRVRRRCRFDCSKACLPLLQALPGLVIDFIIDQRQAAPMIGVVPLCHVGGQGCEFCFGSAVRPVRALGHCQAGEGTECCCNQALHKEHPCSLRSAHSAPHAQLRPCASAC